MSRGDGFGGGQVEGGVLVQVLGDELLSRRLEAVCHEGRVQQEVSVRIRGCLLLQLPVLTVMMMTGRRAALLTRGTTRLHEGEGRLLPLDPVAGATRLVRVSVVMGPILAANDAGGGSGIRGSRSQVLLFFAEEGGAPLWLCPRASTDSEDRGTSPLGGASVGRGTRAGAAQAVGRGTRSEIRCEQLLPRVFAAVVDESCCCSSGFIDRLPRQQCVTRLFLITLAALFC